MNRLPERLKLKKNRLDLVIKWLVEHGEPATVQMISAGTKIRYSDVQNILQRKRVLPVFTVAYQTSRPTTRSLSTRTNWWIAWEGGDEDVTEANMPPEVSSCFRNDLGGSIYTDGNPPHPLEDYDTKDLALVVLT